MISGYIGDVLGGLSGRAFSDGLGRPLSNMEDFANAGFWNSVVSTSGIGPVLQRQIGDRIAP